MVKLRLEKTKDNNTTVYEGDYKENIAKILLAKNGKKKKFNSIDFKVREVETITVPKKITVSKVEETPKKLVKEETPAENKKVTPKKITVKK